MEITIRDIMKMRCMKDAKLISGAKGFNRIVSGVTIIEAPDILDFVKGGELLLTSFYSFTEMSDEKLEKLIEGLSKKSAGLIIKLNRISEVPSVIMDAADKHDFPVIQVPKSVAHVDIMYPILLEIFDNQAYKLNFYKEVHKKLNALALTEPSMDTIIKNLGDILKHPVTLYDKYMRKTVVSHQDYGDFIVIEPLEKNHEKAAFRYFRQYVSYYDSGKAENQTLVPIESVNNLMVYLGIAEGDEGLTELDFISIENAITIISLELIRQHTVLEVERKFKIDLISELLNGTNLPREAIYERANLIGWKILKYYAVVKIEAVMDPSKKSFYSNDEYMADIENLQPTVLENLSNMLPKSITKSDNNIFTILWPIEDCAGENYLPQIKDTLEKLEQNIRIKTQCSYINVGIGKITNDVKELAKSQFEAEDALKFGKIAFGENKYVSFTELGAYRFLCSFPDLDRLGDFMSDKLKILLEYEKSHNGQLLETLEMFLRCNLNASRTAKEMYIHHKSVVYRLERIKTIAGIDFNSSEDVLDIQLSLRIHHFLNVRMKSL